MAIKVETNVRGVDVSNILPDNARRLCKSKSIKIKTEIVAARLISNDGITRGNLLLSESILSSFYLI